jgi:formate dehydrogenase maturation protein FdhE
VPPSKSTRRPSAASNSLAEQFRPLVFAHEAVRQRGHARVDVASARARVRAGRSAFDAATVLRESSDLKRSFDRTSAAFERSGIATTPQLAALREHEFELSEVVQSWANGDSLPRGAAARLARSVAGVVGNAVLSRAAAEVVTGFSLAGWKRLSCPCCGASPDLALATDHRRTLVCWRCDTMWRTETRGCLGCGADTAPTLARVRSPALGYELTICNSCGRYIKERRGAPAHALLVERALTAGLDEAAQQRGLRA